MKVICSGMPKTGTKTLSAALRIIGYKVYDVEEQLYYVGKDLIKVMEEGWTIEDLRRIFDGVDAVTDGPACFFWEDLLKAFPEAKVVHAERSSEEQYLKSLEKQLQTHKSEKLLSWLVPLTPSGRHLMRFMNAGFRIWLALPPRKPWYFPPLNKPLALLRYRQHNTYVRETAPKDKLLIFNVTEGWEPLCKFLDVPVPKEKFPHRNKGGSITREIIDKSYIFVPIKREISILAAFSVCVFSLFVYYIIF